MDLFSILSFDERIIVASCPQERIIITWNQSNTFQSWTPMQQQKEDGDQWWEEVSVRTNGGRQIYTFIEAREYALRWLREGTGDER